MADVLQVKKQEERIQDKDEGWWASVLADEEKVFHESKEINCKPCETRTPSQIDWDCVKSIYDRDEVVLLEVTGYNRGGLLVQNAGVQGFVPISHLIDLPSDSGDEVRQQQLAGYVGKSLYLKIIECEVENERIVFSERAAQAGEGKRKELFAKLTEGAVACGVVTNITDFGAFVDLGGVEGLIHVSELSWGRVENPAKMLSVGEKVKVIVLQVNESNSRIALSMKRLAPNPWDRLVKIYKPGDIVSAELTSIMRFGIFARLDEGVEGLIHISSFPDSLRNKDVTEHYFPGQRVQVKILHVDVDRRRLGLGLISEE
jgi:small subunit ribosomal protein S1